MTEIEKRIREFFNKDSGCLYCLKYFNFPVDVEITFNGKTEHFSKEELINLLEGVDFEWITMFDTWVGETKFNKVELEYSLLGEHLMSHFKKLEQSNE